MPTTGPRDRSEAGQLIGEGALRRTADGFGDV